MIAKNIIGRSFKGVCNYLLSKVEKGQGKILEVRNVREDRQEMIADFVMSSKLYNENLTRCVWHASLSFDKADNLADEKMLEIAKEWMTGLGLYDTQWAIIKHSDLGPDRPHLHIVAQRIADDGHTISDSNNYKRSESLCRDLEKKHNLTRLPEVRQEEKINQEKLRGRDRAKSQIHLAIQSSLRKARTAKEFELLLKEKKVECLWKLNSDGSIRGLSFEFEENKIKASEINRIYSARHIQKYFEKKQKLSERQLEREAKKFLNTSMRSAETIASINDDTFYDEGVIRLDKIINSKQHKHGR